MPSVMTMTTHVAPSSPTDILLKIKEFLDALGWTITEWRTNCAWNTSSPYGWLAGTQSFLQVKTTGYGNQNAIYRFQAVDDGLYNGCSEASGGSIANNWAGGQIRYSMVDPRYPTYATSATVPRDQNSLISIGASYNRYYSALRLPAGAAVKMWLFGNDKFCWVAIQLSATYITHIAFGVPELLNQAWPGGQFIYVAGRPGDSFWECWWGYGMDVNNSMHPCYGYIPGVYTANQVTHPALHYALNNRPGESGRVAIGPASMEQVLIPSSWSGIRPMLQEPMYYYSTAEGVYRQHAVAPWCRCAFMGGLAIGEELTYGAETYVVLPVWGCYCMNYDSTGQRFPGSYPGDAIYNLFGVAFRTA